MSQEDPLSAPSQPPRRNRFVGGADEAAAWAKAFDEAVPAKPPAQFTPEELTAAILQLMADGDEAAAKVLADLAGQG